MPHSLRVRLKKLQRKGELSEKDIDRIFKALEQEPCEVSEYDKDHIWYKGHQYISLRRFLEVKAEAEKGGEQMSFSTGFRKCQKCGKMGLFGKFCKECENYELGQKIEPCDDVVSRQAVLKIIDGWYEQNRDTENIEDLIVLITYMDFVRPQEQTGHWEDLHRCWVCSECGQETHIEHNYCPNCGAKMVEPQESEVRNENNT